MTDLFASDEASTASAARERRPSLHSDTDIYRAVAELGKVVTVAAVNMPREAKPVVGRQLVDEVMWMGVLVRRTNIAREAAKLPHLEQLLEQVELVQFGLRVARECRYLPNSAFEASLPLTVSVARQATALRNHFGWACPDYMVCTPRLPSPPKGFVCPEGWTCKINVASHCGSAELAKVAFVVFVVLFLVTMVAGLLRRP